VQAHRIPHSLPEGGWDCSVIAISVIARR
jgi:hypothetical protein